MPEVDKDEILAAHHISQESMLGIDVSALPHANPIGAAGAPASYHQSVDDGGGGGMTQLLMATKNYEHDRRPLTAPPPSSAISRSEIRTFSEPSATPPLPPPTPLLSYNDDLSYAHRYPSPPLAHPLSWHPHVYAKPPKAPTPHSIGDILGLPPPPQRPNDYGLRAANDSNVSRSTISQILNSKPSDGSGGGGDASKLLLLQQQQTSNHLHDRLLLGTSGTTTSVAGSNFENGATVVRNFSGTRSERSMSEGSEDDNNSAISDQPLNLCISRPARDSAAASPLSVVGPIGVKTAIKHKKGIVLTS